MSEQQHDDGGGQVAPVDESLIDRLRRQLAEAEARAQLEDEARAAKEHYRANPDDPEAKEMHRRAGQALADAREGARIATAQEQHGVSRQDEESEQEYVRRVRRGGQDPIDPPWPVERDDDIDDGDATVRPGASTAQSSAGKVG